MWKASRQREWRASKRRLERWRRENLVISNYLSKIELYHKNKFNDKTLEPRDFEAEGTELEAALVGALHTSVDQFGRDVSVELDSDVCGHELEDACVGNEATCAEELPSDYTNDAGHNV